MTRNALSLLVPALLAAVVPAAAQPDTTIHELQAVEVAPRPLNQGAFIEALQRGYPPALRDSAIGGEVLVRFGVGTDGVPFAASVASASRPGFEEASLAAVQVLRFEPAKKGGQPVRVWVHLPVVWTATVVPAAAAADAPAPPPAMSAAAPAPRVYEVEEVEVKPRLTNGAALVRALERNYPAEMADRGISATVTVVYVIDEEGRPTDARVVQSTSREFDEATLRAVSVMRFSPARVGGQPVPVRITQPIRWTVSGPPR
ncbi:MAG TPA: energy transducer TonB [Longimicrobium sp.]|nr:energy transducer TonB [Longimicrobium sp.]